MKKLAVIGAAALALAFAAGCSSLSDEDKAKIKAQVTEIVTEQIQNYKSQE
jgi:outer membrane murein-binding lipoprotein Lpp